MDSFRVGNHQGPQAADSVADAPNPLASSGNAVNFNDIAILRWYPANRTTTFGPSAFSLPSLVAFDGAHIWATNGGDSRLLTCLWKSKLRHYPQSVWDD